MIIIGVVNTLSVVGRAVTKVPKVFQSSTDGSGGEQCRGLVAERRDVEIGDVWNGVESSLVFDCAVGLVAYGDAYIKVGLGGETV